MKCAQRLRTVYPLASLFVFLTGADCALAAPDGASSPGIPLCEGLTVVTAINQPSGDYESIKTIESVGPKEVRLKFSYEGLVVDLFGAQLKKMTTHRTILSSDLQSALSYQQAFLEGSDETIPGTTSIGTSRAVLQALKTTGETQFGISNAYAGLVLTADRNKVPNYYSYQETAHLKRVGTIRVAVLVNDQPLQLPAIRAQGEFPGDKAEFDFLDDERNPLTLAFRIGIGAVQPLGPDARKLCDTVRQENHGKSVGVIPAIGNCDRPDGGDRDTLRVIKINYRCAASTPVSAGPQAGTSGTGAGQAPTGAGVGGALERALAATRTADVYSIYFSFNSDAIREESEPTLKEIADVLLRHPDWKLRVGGHTDGLGDDRSNLELSQRRSAAVKNALVARYGIAPTRLATAGFGKSQPKDTNDTLEGRAHNRRVELVRF